MIYKLKKAILPRQVADQDEGMPTATMIVKAYTITWWTRTQTPLRHLDHQNECPHHDRLPNTTTCTTHPMKSKLSWRAGHHQMQIEELWMAGAEESSRWAPLFERLNPNSLCQFIQWANPSLNLAQNSTTTYWKLILGSISSHFFFSPSHA